MPAAREHGATLLFQNACLECYVCKHSPTQLPTVRVVALGGPIDAETVGAIQEIMDRIMDPWEPFNTAWDLRKVPSPPSLGQAVRIVEWGLRNKGRLDNLGKRLTILMPDRLPGLLNAVQFILKVLHSGCPVYLGLDGRKAACWELEWECS